MAIIELLRKKRFGGELTESEIKEFINGIVSGEVEDYQASAMLMAICINGMTDRETLALTLAMARSGEMLELSDIPGVCADKHSTGGVGDTTTLILVPLVAACGVNMAKMSGRGLGFTGGTLDKLEAIPGMRVDLSIEDFKKQVRDIGCAVIGQSAQLAPADGVMYALRDVTGTVDCMPLVVSSIVSKKLAAGTHVAVLDVKYGRGAIAKTAEDAKALAEFMVRIGNMSLRNYSALITSMDEPLGMYVGNALEVEEAIYVLSGKSGGALKEVSLALGAQMLTRAGAAKDIETAKRMLEEKIASGEGLEKLAAMIRRQGGDPRVVYDVSLLPKAKSRCRVTARRDGYITGVDAEKIGYAAKMLGAGREKKSDIIDPAVGVVLNKRVGDRVSKGETLCEAHANPKSDAIGAVNLLDKAFEIGDKPVAASPLIKYVVD